MIEAHKFPLQLFWMTPEMFDRGWAEFRDGVILRHEYREQDVILRDAAGNLLVRPPRPPQPGDVVS